MNSIVPIKPKIQILCVKEVSEMKKKLLILKRKKAKELHEKSWSNRKIAWLGEYPLLMVFVNS